MSEPYAMQLLRQSLGGATLSGGCCGSALMGGALPRKPQVPTLEHKRAPPVAPEIKQQRLQQGFTTASGRYISPEQYAKLISPETRAKAKQTKYLNNLEVYNKAQQAEAAGTPMSRLQICQYKCEVVDRNRKARSGGKVPQHIKTNPQYLQAKAKVRVAKNALSQAITAGQDARGAKQAVLQAEQAKRAVVKELMSVSV